MSKRLWSGAFSGDDIQKMGRAYPWQTAPRMGERVMLNSGGPCMVVVDIPGADTVICAWLVGDVSH